MSHRDQVAECRELLASAAEFAVDLHEVGDGVLTGVEVLPVVGVAVGDVLRARDGQGGRPGPSDPDRGHVDVLGTVERDRRDALAPDGDVGEPSPAAATNLTGASAVPLDRMVTGA
ncbi:hypothetical protein [Streptomyces sp. NPDC002172]